MNQAILFNDDVHFLEQKKCWCFSGLLAGSLVKIFIPSKDYQHELAQLATLKFDWEALVEEWLEENEPDENNDIKLC